MIIKLLILGGLIYGVYLLFFKNGGLLQQVSDAANSKTKKKKERQESETVVECSKCGVFVSTKEAVIKDGKFYCSKECAGVK